MHEILTVALPVFALIGAGAFCGRLSILTLGDAQTLNKFVFRAAMPVALFAATSKTAPPSLADAPLVGAFLIASLTTLALALVFFRARFDMNFREAGAHAFSCSLGNAVFLGLPIALAIEGWSRPYILLMLAEGLVIITAGAALIAPRTHQRTLLMRIVGFFMKAVQNPLVVGSTSGFIVAALGIEIAGPLRGSLDYAAPAAGPTALFSLGLFLATNHFPRVRDIAPRIASIAAFKLAFLPALALGTASLFGVDDTVRLGVIALFTFVPSGVVTFIMAQQYAVAQSETAAAVLATTVLSLVTVSGVLYVFA